MTVCDVAIIGAGPYGLSAAAHLRTIKGLEVRAFGEPMSFWSANMPVGMFLRSNWTATQIACPQGALTLEAFQQDQRRFFAPPIPIEQFVQYGLWYQRHAVPDLDRRRISCVEHGPKGFTITIEDGEIFESRRVVIAGGIARFIRWPREIPHLAPELVTHSSEHSGFNHLRAKEVLVVGSGQSALESAALLHEAGAVVQVVGRSAQIHWLQGWLSKMLHHRMGETTRDLLYAPTDVGPAGISQLLARPNLLRKLPRSVQDKLRKRATRPAGARWLFDRLGDVAITLDCSITSVLPAGDRLRVSLSTGKEITVDHIVLGTGFHIDICKYEFLGESIKQQIERVNGFPKLNDGLETSVPGLHILGAPAAYSFGPLLQFVSGTHFASALLLRSFKNGHSKAVQR